MFMRNFPIIFPSFLSLYSISLWGFANARVAHSFGLRKSWSFVPFTLINSETFGAGTSIYEAQDKSKSSGRTKEISFIFFVLWFQFTVDFPFFNVAFIFTLIAPPNCYLRKNGA